MEVLKCTNIWLLNLYQDWNTWWLFSKMHSKLYDTRCLEILNNMERFVNRFCIPGNLYFCKRLKYADKYFKVMHKGWPIFVEFLLYFHRNYSIPSIITPHLNHLNIIGFHCIWILWGLVIIILLPLIITLFIKFPVCYILNGHHPQQWLSGIWNLNAKWHKIQEQ